MIIRCIDGYRPAHECNQRLGIIETWLKANVGKRWSEWDWEEYGHVVFLDADVGAAVIFKLKFGLC